MKHSIRKITTNEYFEFEESHEKIIPNPKYFNKIKEFLKEFGYESNDVSILNTDIKSFIDFSHNPSDNKVRKKEGKNPLITISLQIHEYDDEWFILKFWNNYATQYEKIDIYLCDQFEAVIHQLNQCFELIPKINDERWNNKIEKEFIKKRDELLKQTIDKWTKHIMSFKTFQELDEYKYEYLM